ncbi:MAG: hypothetical protein PF637_06430 [Spirochaetes bacterium]|jgi:hypothetical protein|nr:hypothetical protein [Spirochaetota bacterium]
MKKNKLILIIVLISIFMVSCKDKTNKLIFPFQLLEFDNNYYTIVNIVNEPGSYPGIFILNDQSKIKQLCDSAYIVDLEKYHYTTPQCKLIIYKNNTLHSSILYNSSKDINFQGYESLFIQVDFPIEYFTDKLPEGIVR